MCELMGMSFAKPIVANVSIKAFSQRSVENADGWGLAWYPDRSLAMVKQPLRWSVQHTQFLDSYPGLLSSIYVAHVRHKTTGSTPTHADTHPFSRELGGREYCFAHNGTLTGDFWQRPLGRFRPIGGTDSEFLFCLLLAELEQSEGRLDAEPHWKSLHQFLDRLNDFGKLNCLLTDGERLVAYHDKKGWKGLTYRNIFLLKDTAQHFSDAMVAVNLQADPVNHGCIVATNPLSAEGWERFLPGEMKVLHQGNIVYSSRPALQDAKAPPDGVRPVRSAESPRVLAGAKAKA